MRRCSYPAPFIAEAATQLLHPHKTAAVPSSSELQSYFLFPFTNSTFKLSCNLHLQKPQERYVEDTKEKGGNYEQKRWEEDHLSAAILHFGAKDSKERRKVWACARLRIKN